jgi:hypothetical protein
MKHFCYSVANLPIADSAKAIIESVLEAECSPTSTLNPSRAWKRQNIIMGDIYLSLYDMFYPTAHYGESALEANTLILAKRLKSVAKGYRIRRKWFFENCFRVLSELLT